MPAEEVAESIDAIAARRLRVTPISESFCACNSAVWDTVVESVAGAVALADVVAPALVPFSPFWQAASVIASRTAGDIHLAARLIYADLP
jgi:hypothetical protein